MLVIKFMRVIRNRLPNKYIDYIICILTGNERACGKKVDYKSKASATKSALAMEKKSGKPFEAYPCYFCKGWHIGHTW